MMIAPLELEVAIEPWSLAEPFEITGHIFEHIEVLVVTLTHAGMSGRGEAAGVYYKGDDTRHMATIIEQNRRSIEKGLSRDRLQALLPAGGARNALDCALWDLEAKRAQTPVWRLAGLEQPKSIRTTFTCGADSPEAMANAARRWTQATALKLKLTGVPLDEERVEAVRAARPDVWLAVDGNQGFNPRSLEALMPTLLAADVALIEQPFPVGRDEWLGALEVPIAVAADESAQSAVDLDTLARHYNAINIKLDKCGGLTAALEMIARTKAIGLKPMVGCMPVTSLGIAPAFLAGQLADIVDLDSPAFLKSDRESFVTYSKGCVFAPTELWGGVTVPVSRHDHMVTAALDNEDGQ